MVVTLFVLLGVGIYYHANLWPDYQKLFIGGWAEWRIWTILYVPYWQLYGEPNLESFRGNNNNISNILITIKTQEIADHLYYATAALKQSERNICTLTD